jgi:intracellular septation protein A
VSTKPAPPQTPGDLLKRGDLVVDSALSPAVFVIGNLVWGLTAGALAALALSVLIFGYRIARKQPLTYAGGGVFGTAIAVAIALGTGNTEGFFWPKVLTNTLIALGLLGSVAVKRPAIGFLLEALLQVPERWWRHDRVRPALSQWTLVWGATAAIKAVVYLVLIVQGKDGALLGVSVAFGYPLSAALIFGGYAFVRLQLRRAQAPTPDEVKAEIEAEEAASGPGVGDPPAEPSAPAPATI